MEILKIHEEVDGYVKMDCEFAEVELEILLSYAVTNILKEQIEKMDKRECFDCGEEITSETIEQHPDTEICSECLNNE